MSTNRTPVAREPRGRITPEQESALRYGHPPDAFESEAEEAAAWAKHRGSMLHLFARNGHRPIAWWRHDAEELGLVWPGYDREKSTLYEAGALSEPEAAALIMFWREQFDRCHQPGFVLCEGPGQWLKGRAARAAHLEWADVPKSLIAKWTAERRSAARDPRSGLETLVDREG